MKKRLLTALFTTIVCCNIHASINQGVWRWRNDDGNEITATWKAEENTPVTINSDSEHIRLRIEYNNDATDPQDLSENLLQYALTDAGPWIDITNDGSTNAFMLAGNSLYVTDLESTTEQLNSTSDYPFTPGKIIVSSIIYGADEIPGGAKTEFEWVFKPTENVQSGTTYYFKSSKAGESSTKASLTTASILPINLIAFNVSAEGSRVKILWTTASEQNNDRFEIQRSVNGKDNWQTVATQKGSGTTTQTHTYTAYDNHPMNGLNYYRIKQYDLDGKSKESVIRSVSMQLIKAIIAAYPNPTKGPINFTINNFKGNSVTAVLSDMKGSVIHKEIVSVNTAISNYKLDLKSKPAAGMFVLQLKGDDLNQSINIVVQ